VGFFRSAAAEALSVALGRLPTGALHHPRLAQGRKKWRSRNRRGPPGHPSSSLQVARTLSFEVFIAWRGGATVQKSRRS